MKCVELLRLVKWVGRFIYVSFLEMNARREMSRKWQINILREMQTLSYSSRLKKLREKNWMFELSTIPELK